MLFLCGLHGLLLGLELVLLHDTHKVLLLFGGLESAVTELGRSIDELELNLLEGHTLGLCDERSTQRDGTLASTTDAALQHDKVLLDDTVLWEATHWSDALLDRVKLSLGASLIRAQTNAVDLLVDLGTMEVALLTGTSHRERDARRMPRTNTGNLAETLVCLARQLACVPTRGDTLETATLGDGDSVQHFVLREHLVDVDLLLEVITSKLDLVGNAATVKLDLHDVSLLLSLLQQFHLSVSNDTDHLTVLGHLGKVLLDLLLARLVLPLLGVLGEGLLL